MYKLDLEKAEEPEGFPCSSVDKESAYNAGDLGSIPGSDDPMEEEMAAHSSFLEWQLTPVFLPGESYRQKSLVGYSPCVGVL